MNIKLLIKSETDPRLKNDRSLTDIILFALEQQFNIAIFAID